MTVISTRQGPAASLSARDIWLSYTTAELLPTQFYQGLNEVGRLYRLGFKLGDALVSQLRDYVNRTESLGLSIVDASRASAQIARAADSVGAEVALELLPDPEFLTAYQHAAVAADRSEYWGSGRGPQMRQHADKVFERYGLPYKFVGDEITWVGDPVVRSEVIEPVLKALGDPRISGAQDEFLQAQAALRSGTPDKLRDATHEAGNSVEAVLLALIQA
jgi:hypothetical protein